ncbi:hypothetical protein GCM10010269_60680 [Streptomyces humidus]|uniref:Integral membrane protein n=1 Tax=Streptomyces humidus TaxID=52259 RepID=A0A918L6E1_9ACTN|nr:hypothetical protein [Streptomyces humidus]GGS13266.1 hypothetical protein GCM10010269_60680 [Streptomyces humidus]
MAGTDEDAVAAADDALYVLTAVLLTPAKFPSALGDDYPEACAALGLPPLADGYGLVLGQDGEGARWTVVIDDVSLVAVAIASWDCGMEYDLSPAERTVVAALPGWPLAVAVAAPGVPAPHDPAPEVADGPALRPPDASTWGPAQRRLGADEIALQWALWREQIDDTEFVPSREGGAGTHTDAVGAQRADRTDQAREGGRPGTTSAPGAASGPDGDGEAPGSAGVAGTGEAGEAPEARKDAPGGHSDIRRVLAEVRAYVDTPPPLGRVRSSFAPGEARTLRADGPGWSLVARTDDIAFVLLDDKPGEVLPIGRGPELPGLLEALDKMAVRPL